MDPSTRKEKCANHIPYLLGLLSSYRNSLLANKTGPAIRVDKNYTRPIVLEKNVVEFDYRLIFRFFVFSRPLANVHKVRMIFAEAS